MANTSGTSVNLTGYPISIGGNKQFSTFDHTGPQSYVTGGEQVQASDMCLAAIDFVIAAAYSASGNFVVYALYYGTVAVTYITLVWFNVLTGAQADPGTDLSGEHIRLGVVGVA